jgi:hypothetical protein
VGLRGQPGLNSKKKTNKKQSKPRDLARTSSPWEGCGWGEAQEAGRVVVLPGRALHQRTALHMLLLLSMFSTSSKPNRAASFQRLSQPSPRFQNRREVMLGCPAGNTSQGDACDCMARTGNKGVSEGPRGTP